MKYFWWFLLLLLVGSFWIYFEKPELIQRMLAKSGASQFSDESQPGRNSGSNEKDGADHNQQAPSANPTWQLVLPETEMNLFVNGRPAGPGRTLEVKEPRAVVIGYQGDLFSHEVISNQEGAGPALKTKTQKAASGWSTFQGNGQRTGFVKSKNRGALKPLWQGKLGDKVQSSPVIVNGVIYLSGERNRIFAVDLASGKLLWKIKGGGGLFSPLVNDDFVFMGNNMGSIDGFRLNDGNQMGKNSLGSYPTIGTRVTNDQILVVTRDSHLYLLNSNKASDGTASLKVQWEADLPQLGNCTAAPLLQGDRIILQTESHGLLAVSLGDGAVVWPKKEVAREEVPSFHTAFVDESRLLLPTPASDGQIIYAAMDQALIAVDLKNGREIWRRPLESSISSSLSLAYGILYFGCADGKLRACSSVDGSTIFQIDCGNNPMFATPTIFFDKLLLATPDGRVLLYNGLTGEELDVNRTISGSPIDAAPAVSENAIFVVNRSGEMVCFQ